MPAQIVKTLFYRGFFYFGGIYVDKKVSSFC